MIKTSSGAFGELLENEIGEIKNKSKSEEWSWVDTKNNLADMGTREDVKPCMMVPGSKYQNGLDWMNQEEEFWPVDKNPGDARKEFESELTTAAKKVMVASMTEQDIPWQRFQTFKKAQRVTATVLMSIDRFRFKQRNRENLKNEKIPVKMEDLVVSEYLEKAEDFLFYQAQWDIRESFQKKNLASLLPVLKKVNVLGKEVELVVMNGRLENSMSIGYDKTELPILSYKSPLSRQIINDAHDQGHGGMERTLLRARNIAWVVQGGKMAKRVCGPCTICKRKKGASLEKQKMAPLPEFRVKPAPVFYTTSLDLFGPVLIIDTVKRRTSRKAWGVVFCCTATGAIHLETTENYSCDSFLQALKRFMNLRGTPNRIISDPGTQLMAAAIRLGNWKFDRIVELEGGLKWEFIPVNSQHYNGLSEAMVKQTKIQLSILVKDRKLTKGELDTVLSDIQYIINSRPLNKRAGTDPLSGGPITPLHLLGGRATKEVPKMDLDQKVTLVKRLQFLDKITDEFWKKWFLTVFHNLIPCQKWRKEERNVLVGDVVLLKDSNLMKKGEYKLARVKEVRPSLDGHSRRVILEYKTHPTDEKLKTTERSIHGFIVIAPVDFVESKDFD